MLRLKLCTRSLAGLTFLLVFLLTAFAQPVLAQSSAEGDSLQFRTSSSKFKFGADFGDVVVGTTSPPMTVGLVNHNKKKNIKIKSISVSPPFSEVSDTCDGSLSAGSICDIIIVFSPTSAGEVLLGNGLMVKSNGGNLKFALSGNGITGSPTPTATGTPTATSTATATATATSTSSHTPTATATSTVTSTPTATGSGTPTASATATATSSPTATATATGGTPTATATATQTATETATSTSTGGTPTATATATHTATATATATGGTPTATATATHTATATATSTSTPTATATSTPSAGPQAGDVLIAGGDTGGLLQPFGIPLATSTISTASSEIYEAIADAFALVGPLNDSREATATAVVLGNQKTLIVGGSHCFAQAINKSATIAASPTGATESGGTVTITATSAHGFDVGQMVAISGVGVAGYNGTFTIASITSNTKFTYTDATTGLAASGGGTATQNPNAACGTSTFVGFQCDALNTAELYSETSSTTGSFTLAGSGSGGHMTAARSGAAATLLANGKVLITGGSTGSTFLSLSPPPAGCGPAGQVAQNTAEIYDPAADSFAATTSIPGCPAGTACATGLPAICGTGMAQCGLVDSSAVLLNDNTVLVTGGDYLVFLGQSSPQAFIYTPSGPSWTETMPMKVARELPGITKLASGHVLVTGGLTGEAAACVGLPAACTGAGTPNGCCTGAGTGTTCGALAIITNSSAEIFDPVAHTWTLTTGSSATPGAAGGMIVPRISSAELFSTGPDAGLAIVAGGISANTPSFPSCSQTATISQTTTTATDLFTESGGGVFTATGALNQDRGGYGFGILNNGPNSGDLVVIGGECAPGGLGSAPIGSAEAGTACDGGSGTGQTDYYELYSPAGATWTLGTKAPASTPANAPAYAVQP